MKAKLSTSNHGSNDRPSVAVAMSGGVDSSVAAAMLVEAGYRTVGFTMKLWDAEDDQQTRKPCCTATMARDAGQVCQLLGIPHYTLDLREEFRREVIDQFEAEYLKAATPNPCVRCNSLLKWGKLWEKAQALGLERLATGHYARVEFDRQGRSHLLRGVDEAKDQSYFLWQIPPDLLNVTLFPLGGLTKPDIRRKAGELHLPVANKQESQEICFIPQDDYRSWLRSRVNDLADGKLSGELVDAEGEIVGRHEGFPFFTIGQRRGLGLGGGASRLFVTRIDPETQRVYLGTEQDLMQSSFSVGDLNLLQSEALKCEEPVTVKIRYRDSGVPATIKHNGGSVIIVDLVEPVKAVTPGQSAVFYRDDEVIAGGIIQPDNQSAERDPNQS